MQGRRVIAHCVTEYRGRPYMEAHLLWLIVGIVLIAAELATGTFYLLFLGLAALVGCTGLLVHSFFDFNLQIPANASIFYFLCAVATHTAQSPLRGTTAASSRRKT